MSIKEKVCENCVNFKKGAFFVIGFATFPENPICKKGEFVIHNKGTCDEWDSAAKIKQNYRGPHEQPL